MYMKEKIRLKKIDKMTVTDHNSIGGAIMVISVFSYGHLPGLVSLCVFNQTNQI
jgi:aspartate carbamoyltransferase regulatory subunit